MDKVITMNLGNDKAFTVILLYCSLQSLPISFQFIHGFFCNKFPFHTFDSVFAKI